tara:strand:+ start:5482 stop:7311 length:1830 start_codon:yes stop_codon:yes gene_type:complete
MAYGDQKNQAFVKTKIGEKAPKGFHYMPNGKLMSDADHIAIYGYIKKEIKNIDFSTQDINYIGETKIFTLTGDNGALFSIEVSNENTADATIATHYYNFDTKSFSVTKPKLNIIELSGNHTFNVKFPKIAYDSDHNALLKYTIRIIAHIGSNIKTTHIPLVERRFANDTVDLNNSQGSDSNVLTKILYQDTAKTLSLGCIAPSKYATSAGTVNVPGDMSSTARMVLDQDATDRKIVEVGDKITCTGILADIHTLVTSVNPDNDNVNELEMSTADSVSDGAAVVFTPPFNGMTPHYTDSETGESDITISSGGSTTTSFSITCTALTGRTFTVNRVPTASDLCAVIPVTFASAASAISGEDTSSDSVFYRWPITNIANLSTGMTLDSYRTGSGANTSSAKAIISNYLTTKTLQSVTETTYSATIQNETVADVSVNGVDSNYNPVTGMDRNGRITAQAGNITFDVQQVDELKSDSSVKILAHGPAQIKAATGMDVSLSNVIITPTQISTTCTLDIFKNQITVAEVGNISAGMTVRSVDIFPLTANPTVSKKGVTSGAGSVSVDIDQRFVNGQTYFFDGASNVVTITGDITISNMAIADATLYFDVERFLTAQ